MALCYQPDQYPELLKSYMQEAYAALEHEDQHHYEMAVSKITMELKYVVKSHFLTDGEAEEMKSYFWGQVV